jgi:hypothetical protein
MLKVVLYLISRKSGGAEASARESFNMFLLCLVVVDTRTGRLNLS